MNSTPADDERDETLAQRIVDGLERPMIALGFLWLALLVVEFARGLTPGLRLLGTVIWIIFLLDFLLELALSESKPDYLRRHWLTALALVVPALRLFRLFRMAPLFRVAARAPGIRTVQVLGSLNRGMRALGSSLKRRGFGYVAILTLLVGVGGAAGMYALERDAPGGGYTNFGDALWWSFMILTTMGTDYWPRTGEGRLLCFGLALYAFAMFGYVTATLASFLVGRDTVDESARKTQKEGP